MNLTDEDFPLIGDWDANAISIALIVASDRRGRALMQLRDDYDNIIAPAHWSFFGGHVDPGEAILPCALREMREETGVALRPDELVPLCRLMSAHRHRWYAFSCRRPIGPSDICLGEGAGFAFVTRRQIDQYDLVPCTRDVWQQYCDAADPPPNDA